MTKRMRDPESGIGRAAAFGLFILTALVVTLGAKVFRNAAPTLVLSQPPKGIGLNTPIAFEVRDHDYSVKRIGIEVEQGGHSYSVPYQIASVPARTSWWKFWAKRPEGRWDVTAHVGRNQIHDLQEGHATVVLSATNDSWSRFFRGGRVRVNLDLPVRFTPPQIAVLTTQHYINQGGCDMVVFTVSPGTVESGVQVGQYFFPSFPISPSKPETRLALFAYPWNLDPSTPTHLVARDDAGNQSVSSFTYEVFPKRFHTDTIQLSDEFMNRVVPAILSQTPELNDQGSLLKNFLEINGRLRQIDSERLVEISKHTASQFLWTEPFLRLPSKTEAFFADSRTYVYNGQVVDHQTHLGFDLAGLEHMPVLAANDGQVAFAGFFGIYGNAVVIDHGCGLQTLYGHMSRLDVKAGDAVKRGQQIGVSGETGLAGGDHLHFTVLLDGVPVNPTEWWDPHWIHDRIEAKLATYR